MRLVLLIVVSFIGACASNHDLKPVTDSLQIQARTFAEKKVIIRKTLANHPEFSQDKKEEIKNILISSLERTEKLRERESQLLQQIFRYTIEKQGSFKQIVALKSELRTVYDRKFENFNKAITRLKKVVGIKAKNKELVSDIAVIML